MHIFSKAIAVELAKHDRNYVALSIGNDEYVVWDCASDHRVEFDDIGSQPRTVYDGPMAGFPAWLEKNCAAIERS